MPNVELQELVADAAVKSLQRVSGNHFRTRQSQTGFLGGETAYHDRLVWEQERGVVRCERAGSPDAFVPLSAVAVMIPAVAEQPVAQADTSPGMTVESGSRWGRGKR